MSAGHTVVDNNSVVKFCTVGTRLEKKRFVEQSTTVRRNFWLGLAPASLLSLKERHALVASS